MAAPLASRAAAALPARPALLLPLLALLPVAAATGEAVTPIQKVVQLMQDMHAKGVEEKKAEGVRFGAFQQFCKDTSSAKSAAIETATERLGKLGADIEKAAADVDAAADKITELDEDLARWKKDQEAAADVRGKERVDFVATRQGLTDAIDACDRAVARLQAAPGKVPQEDLVQVQQAASTPPAARLALAAFLASSSSSAATPGEGGETFDKSTFEEKGENPRLFREAPEAYAYESKSGGVIGMIKDLRLKFREEASALDKEELNARHAFNTVSQRLTAQMDLAHQERGQKVKFKAEREEDKARAEGEKESTEAAKDADEKYLEELTGLCRAKSADFESRQQLREEELQALAKAIEIVSSGDVAAERLPGGGVADGADVSGTSLAQLRRNSGPRPPALQRVAALLRERAAATASPSLTMLAKRAAEDPFDKVKQMIRELLTRLMEEAAGEADHKAWCDAEMATNKQTRTIKSQEVDELAAEADKLTATEAELAQRIADLHEDVADIEKAMQKAAAERKEEKEQNEAAIEDAKQSQRAIAEALAVLREFYAKAGEATALLQQRTVGAKAASSTRQAQSPAEDAPELFGEEPYKGMQGESGGVLGLLEVIEADFARLEVTTDTAEREAAAEHLRFMGESDKDKAVAQTEIEHNTDRLGSTRQMLASTQKALEQTRSALDAALKYYEKLKPTCVGGSSYDERVKRRQEELVSLREAYKILDGQDLATLS